MANRKLTNRKDSGLELPSTTRESTKKTTHRYKIELPNTKLLVLRDIGYPFRIKGDPKPTGLEIDSEELFEDYAREQWIGTIVKKDIYLFDRYILPDFAFQVIDVEPDKSVIAKETHVRLESKVDIKISQGRCITLDDIVGHELVKKKCRLILKYLVDSNRFGEWAPRAVLFHGPPGTGKTLTAKAVSNEADARIFIVKASDLIGMHVGDGGRRISALFENARKHAPSIVFIDEIDAIGLTRSFQSIRGDVSEVVTSLLGEFDRTDETSGVVIICSTNAIQLIDSALYSRFDAVFEFSLPDEDERLRIINMYAKRLPIPLDIEYRTIAKKTKGLSGRDIRNHILKESLHQAILDNRDSIGSDIILKILDRIQIDNMPDYSI